MQEGNIDKTNLTAIGASVSFDSLATTISDYMAATIPSDRPAQASLLQSLGLKYSHTLTLKPKYISKTEWQSEFKTLFSRLPHIVNGIYDGKPSRESLKNDGFLYGFIEGIFNDAIHKDLQKTALKNQSKADELTPSLIHLKGRVAQARDEIYERFKARFTPYGNALDHILSHMDGMTLVTGTDGITRKQFEGLAKAAIAQQKEFRDTHKQEFPTFEEEFIDFANQLYAKAMTPQLSVVPSGEETKRIATSSQLEIV